MVYFAVGLCTSSGSRSRSEDFRFFNLLNFFNYWPLPGPDLETSVFLIFLIFLIQSIKKIKKIKKTEPFIFLIFLIQTIKKIKPFIFLIFLIFLIIDLYQVQIWRPPFFYFF